MKKFRLKPGTKVSVHGRDYRGFATEIQFSETSREGWYWRPFPEGPLLPIEASLARYYKVFGFIYLRYGYSSFAVWEHIAAMFYTGLTGVIVEGSPHPPSFGRPLEYWEALKPYLIESKEEVQWCRPLRPVEWSYPGSRRGYTRIEPNAKPFNLSLHVDIEIDYPRIGRLRKEFFFPSTLPLFVDAFNVHAQGYPNWKWRAAQLLSQFGWPHINAFVWPHEQTTTKTADLWWKHRLTDLMGGISLAAHNRLLAGKITSVCSGHLADLEVLRLADFIPSE